MVSGWHSGQYSTALLLSLSAKTHLGSQVEQNQVGWPLKRGNRDKGRSLIKGNGTEVREEAHVCLRGHLRWRELSFER